MPSCSAINCSNRTEKKFRLFRFPADSKRRLKWIQNMGRDDWNPTNSSFLCEIHFDESQYETKRADGWKKLKPNAVPTLFKLPNTPPMIDPSPGISNYQNLISCNSANVQLFNPVPRQDNSIRFKTPPIEDDYFDRVEMSPSQDNSTLFRTPLFEIENHVINYMSNTLIKTEPVDDLSLDDKVTELQSENEELRGQLKNSRTTCEALVLVLNHLLNN